MKKFTIYILFILFFAVNVSASSFSPNEVIVKYKNSVKNIDRALDSPLMTWLDKFDINSITPLTKDEYNKFFVIRTDKDISFDDLGRIKESSADIEYMQPNYLNEFHATVNDPLYKQQLHNMGKIAEAWNYTTGDPELIIAVIDSGILVSHEDLKNQLYHNRDEIPNNNLDDDNNGYIDDYIGYDFVDAPAFSSIAEGDFVNRDADVNDENFHGTHVSGIIAAETNNNAGIAGVIQHCRLLPIRSGFKTISGSYLQDDDIAAALLYATDMGARVVNMSWGSEIFSPIIADACAYAYDKGVILVASSGNKPGPYISYPAKLSTVISVGSVDKYGILSGFTSYGPELDLVAPGSEIISTFTPNNGYQYLSGTSMSAPYVTGIVGLLLSQNPDMNFLEVKNSLCNSAQDLGDTGFDVKYGYGLVNAVDAITYYNDNYLGINYPQEAQTLSTSFDIIGTVNLDDFFRYYLSYSLEQNPVSTDWLDCSNHSNSPTFYYESVENDIISHFDLQDELSDGDYKLRLTVVDNKGKKSSTIRNIYIDKNLPYVIGNPIFKSRSFGNTNDYFLTTKFSEKVDLVVNFTDKYHNNSAAYSAKIDSVITVKLNRYDLYSDIEASADIYDLAGFNLKYDYNDLSPVFYYLTKQNYFSKHHLDESFSSSKIPCNELVDFDGEDDINEFLAVDNDNGVLNNLSIYKFENKQLKVVESFEPASRPLSIGKTDFFGYDFVSLGNDKAYVFVSLGDNPIPNNSYNLAIDNAIDAQYSKVKQDDDYQKLFVLAKNNNLTEINIYQKEATNMNIKHTILNTSIDFDDNNFVSGFHCANLDGDNNTDIIVADGDNEIMIYEVDSDDNNNYLKWSQKLDIDNINFVNSGDFDGDDNIELIVGGFNDDIETPNNSYFHFYLFKSTKDNEYEQISELLIDKVGQGNSINVSDFDNDGKDELFLALTPYLYMVKYEEDRLKVNSVTDCEENFNTLIYQENSDSDKMLLLNQRAQDNSLSWNYLLASSFEQSSPPQKFRAIRYDNNCINLFWNDQGQKYNVHRELNGVTSIRQKLSSDHYLDYQLEPGDHVRYALSTYDEEYAIPQSELTPWLEFYITPFPRITDIKKLSVNSVQILFNTPLDEEMSNVAHYNIDKNVGFPRSVIINQNCQRVILILKNNLDDDIEKYGITLSDVKSRDSAIVPLIQEVFDNVIDVYPPEVEKVEIISEKEISLEFNEPIYSKELQSITWDNFRLQAPDNEKNHIEKVTEKDNHIFILLANKMKISNKQYHLELLDIQDLNGNKIPYQKRNIDFNYQTIKDLSQIVIYPNPIDCSKDESSVYFTNFPISQKGHLYIYNLAGDLVFKDSIGPFNLNQHYQWNLTNNHNKKVSSGMYFYIIKMGDSLRKDKIAVIR